MVHFLRLYSDYIVILDTDINDTMAWKCLWNETKFDMFIEYDSFPFIIYRNAEIYMYMYFDW